MQRVPDSEALRQAALQASWARDDALRRRKLAWRRLEWFATRFVLPVSVAASFGWMPSAFDGMLLEESDLAAVPGFRLAPRLLPAAGAPPSLDLPPVPPEPPLRLRAATELNTKEKAR